MPATHVVCGNYVSRLDPPAFDLFMGRSDQSVPIPVSAGVTVEFRDDNGWTALALQWKESPSPNLPQTQLQGMIRDAAQFWVLRRTLTPGAKPPVREPRP